MGKIIRNKQYALYSTSACAQFKMAKILDETEKGSKEYIESYNLFVDAAKVKEGQAGQSARNYDWNNKIVLKLGLADIGMFLNGIRLNFDPTKAKGYDAAKPGSGKYQIYHDPGKGSTSEGNEVKQMGISKGERSGYMISFYYKSKTKGTNSFMVPLSDEQMVIFKLLLEQAATLITGFYDAGVELQPPAE